MAEIGPLRRRMIEDTTIRNLSCRPAARVGIEHSALTAVRALQGVPRGEAPGGRGQPGQVRKEAAVTSPAWVVVQPLTPCLSGRCSNLLKLEQIGKWLIFRRVFWVINHRERICSGFRGGWSRFSPDHESPERSFP